MRNKIAIFVLSLLLMANSISSLSSEEARENAVPVEVRDDMLPEALWLQNKLHAHEYHDGVIMKYPQQTAAIFSREEDLKILRALVQRAKELPLTILDPQINDPRLSMDNFSRVNDALQILQIKALPEDYSLMLEVIDTASIVEFRGQAARALAAINPNTAVRDLEEIANREMETFWTEPWEPHKDDPIMQYLVALAGIQSLPAYRAYKRIGKKHFAKLARVQDYTEDQFDYMADQEWLKSKSYIRFGVPIENREIVRIPDRPSPFESIPVAVKAPVAKDSQIVEPDKASGIEIYVLSGCLVVTMIALWYFQRSRK